MSFFLDKIKIFIKNKNKRRLYIFKFLKLISIDVIFFLLSILILPAFVMFKKIINIRICEVQTQRIGHLLLNSELYLCKRQQNILNNKKKNLDIFYSGDFIVNKYFFSLLKKKLKIYPHYFFPIFHKVIKFFHIKNIQVTEIKDNYDKNNYFGSINHLST